MPRDRVGAAAADLPSDLPAGSPAWYAARMRGLFRRERSEADFAAIVAAARAFGELKGRAAESALRLRQFDPELMQRVLPEITLPTLVLWSQASTYLPAEMARTITTQLPDCRGCAVIPQTGHLLLADAPSDAADLILSFLETLALETSA
jgi:pimeloyl-ACP methyl ester carboxylesterase